MDQDLDNNNGPISPADLENIENNNAVDYIPNRNEIISIPDNSNLTTNRNVTENVSIYSSTPNSPSQSTINNQQHYHQQHRDFDNPSSSTSVSMIQQQIESQPSPPSPIALPIPINEVECRVINICSNYHNPFTTSATMLPNDIAINMDQQGSSSTKTWPKSLLGAVETQYQKPYVDDTDHQDYRDNCTSIIPTHVPEEIFQSQQKEDESIPRESQNTLNNNNATVENVLVNTTEEKNEFCSVYIEGEWLKLF